MPRRPTTLHGVAVMLCCFLPGPSVVKQRFIAGETQNAPPGICAGGACRTAPVSGVVRDTLRRITSTVGLCAAPACIVRSVVRRDRVAWLARLRFDGEAVRAMITIREPAHAAALVGAGDDLTQRAHASAKCAHGRAPARGEPARAGMPLTVGSEVEMRCHVISVRTDRVKSFWRRCVPTVIPETTNRAADGRLTRNPRQDRVVTGAEKMLAPCIDS